jgi:hypothetical protein
MADEKQRVALQIHADLGLGAEPHRGVLRDHHPSAIRRGSDASVPDLVGPVRTFIDGWNERCRALTWTRTADEILRIPVKEV